MNFVGLIEAVPEVREVKQKKSEQLPIVPLTTLEVGRLLEHATTPMHRGLFGLCVGVGLRPSEALRVRWEDICFKTATLKVRGTKTDASDASIPLTDLALREMIKWKDVVLFHGSTSQEAAMFYMHKNPDQIQLLKVPKSEETKRVVVKASKVYKAREKGRDDWSIEKNTQREMAEELGTTPGQVNKVVKRRAKTCKGYEIIMEVIPEHTKLVPFGSNRPLNKPASKLPSPISDSYNPKFSSLHNKRKLSPPPESLEGLCFPNPRTGKELGSFKKALDTSARRASLYLDETGHRRRVFPYLLRHSFATLAATSNPPVPLPVAQKVMRHTSSKLLLDVYARAGALVLREGLDNFNL
ncbi:hypothetical protein TrCOL_g8791 [Triparma columacea]|nr:hypothetical protein TrCOL_g8791 [Triparma columacea]